MAFTRENLEPDQYYFDTRTGNYFVSPDAIGCYWYDTLAEMMNSYLVKDINSVKPVYTASWF